MIKTQIAMPLGLMALSFFLAPGASASCGKMAARLSVLMPESHSTANARVVELAPSQGPSVQPGQIAGLWASNVLIDGQVIFQAFESFTGEGLEFLNDNGSPIEGNVCFGTWSSVSKNKLVIYHPAWNYDQNGNLIGTVIIKTRITLDADAGTFNGTLTVDTYDLNGNVVAPQLQADVTGTRVTTN